MVADEIRRGDNEVSTTAETDESNIAMPDDSDASTEEEQDEGAFCNVDV